HSFGIVICPVPNSFNVLVSIKLYNYIIIQLTNYIITQLKILSNMNPAETRAGFIFDVLNFIAGIIPDFC
ncbi:hypothetical protein KKC83_06160, partial [Patescibacteria group bacterium]|nr:hypothetical protein [Patescibacteria group bacterium]MBU4015769.1 hypothetical protein [Patescibacteria group bacterium]MBU4027096.1 hypothetical protein [Patescibacteria group bacterium]MBU4073664.1 hypothetical protein [Patescibacteria group bacterium]MBU4102604.1 hypothetical protein [Patescibacteria group bacterium]